MKRLITIGVSHFCEKARWALDRGGFDYREERHPPAWHILHVKRAGGGRTVPVLIDDDGPPGARRVFADSSAIIQHLDAQLPPERRLVPADGPARAEVLALEDGFDEGLGPATRRVAYFHLLPEPYAADTLVDGVGRLERIGFRLTLPLVKLMMARLLKLDRAGAERSLAKVRATWDQVDALLADGRRYLTGDRFTAADLTFAALAAPAVVVPGYGVELPSLDIMPEELQAIVGELRARPAGAFVTRLYAEERRPVLAGAH